MYRSFRLFSAQMTGTTSTVVLIPRAFLSILSIVYHFIPPRIHDYSSARYRFEQTIKIAFWIKVCRKFFDSSRIKRLKHSYFEKYRLCYMWYMKLPYKLELTPLYCGIEFRNAYVSHREKMRTFLNNELIEYSSFNWTKEWVNVSCVDRQSELTVANYATLHSFAIHYRLYIIDWLIYYILIICL